MRSSQSYRTWIVALVALMSFSAARASAQSVSTNEKPDSTSETVARVHRTQESDRSTSQPVTREGDLKWHSMITNIPGDWHRYLKQTFRTESIAPALAIGIMTVGMVATDEETWRMSEQWYHSSGSVKTWSEVFTSIGDGKSQFGLAAAFGLYGWIRDDSKALRTASQIVQAVLASGSVVQVLKHTTGRESPFVESTPGGAWRLFPNQIEYHKHVANYDAFPSGHLCTSVATVVVVAENYPEITWIKPVGFTVCALVAVGMVNRGIHWYSDYPLGAVIGYSFGMIAAHPESRTATPAQSSELTVLPFVHGGGGGLHLSWQF